MGYCQRCGGYCADNYTFCKRCYIALGSPYGTSISKDMSLENAGKPFSEDIIIALIVSKD